MSSVIFAYVLSMCGYKLQVIWAVVGFNMILVVHYLSRCEDSAYNKLHHKPMFENIASRVGAGVLWTLDIHITALAMSAASFPARAPFHRFSATEVWRVSDHILCVAHSTSRDTTPGYWSSAINALRAAFSTIGSNSFTITRTAIAGAGY